MLRPFSVLFSGGRGKSTIHQRDENFLQKRRRTARGRSETSKDEEGCAGGHGQADLDPDAETAQYVYLG